MVEAEGARSARGSHSELSKLAPRHDTQRRTGSDRGIRLRQLQKGAGVHIARMHPHMLRHTYVTTMLDAGVDLRDTQIAARHADPRTTMRYDRTSPAAATAQATPVYSPPTATPPARPPA